MLILQILKVIILRNNYNDRIFVSFFQSTMRTSLNISAQLTTTAANRVSWTNESYSTWVEFDMRYKLTKEKGCWYIRQMAPPSQPPPPHHTLDAFWVGTHATSPNSCYLTAARRRRGRYFFFLWIWARGQPHAARDKHWVQLLFDSSSSSPWAFFPFTLSISDLVRGRLKIEVMLKIA